MNLQESGEYRISIHGEELSALVVAQRIMRKENFMVAFVNRGMFDLRMPIPWGLCNSENGYTKGYSLSKSVEWSLHICIFNFMFNHKYKIRPAFYMDPSSLKRRFILCGVAHAVFMPFLLFFMTLHFFLINMYVWKSSSQYLGPREWSLIAKWSFREFNELPHVFERRLGPSYEAGDDYLKLFTRSPAVSYLGRAIVFVSGSLVAVLLGLGTLNDSILLHVKLSQWNLLWYVGMLGVAFSIGKGMIPDEKVHPTYAYNLFAEMDSALVKVASYTHYFPETWKKRSWKNETRKEFDAMFQYKSKLFALEVLSTILAPFVLCVSLPKCVEEICTFVHRAKTEVPGNGDMCGYSCFDFDAFEDENWEGKKMGGSRDNSAGRDNIENNSFTWDKSKVGTQKPSDRPKTRHGKMEKSFFSFKAAHPSWKCHASGQNLIDMIERYKHIEAHALAKERQHHIDAAARQLENLLLAERTQRNMINPMDKMRLSQVDETYITKEIENEASNGSGDGTKSTASLLHRAETQSRNTMISSGINLTDNIDSASSSTYNYSDVQQGRDFESNFPSDRPPTSASSLRQFNSVLHSPLATSSNARTSSQLMSPDAAASVLHYADLGLSTELRRMLNRSTFDPGMTIGGGTMDQSLSSQFLPSSSQGPFSSSYHSSVLGDEANPDRGSKAQYLCLERYHSYLAEQNEDETFMQERNNG
mmetsp:Transcript_5331/g.7673  ORF Transcript_5331/g.7673 Transcript_5331/m.7673 type:complete len:702 (-) Transcript_5331:639-2744(-)